MSFRRCIITCGFIILSEGVAFGGGNDQVTAQIVQPADHHAASERLIESPAETQNGRQADTGKQQDKEDENRTGRGASPSFAIAPETGVRSRPEMQVSDLGDSVCLMIEAAGRAHNLRWNSSRG
jgi:hypothetical protein